MTNHQQTKLSVQNTHRSAAKVRRLTPKQLGIPEGEQNQGETDTRWESLRETATEASDDSGMGAAVRTKDNMIASGTQLSQGQSHDVHALELAVLKGYDENKSPVVDAVILTESEEEFPCGRCLQVLSDYSTDEKVTIRVINGNDTDEYQLTEILTQ
jgi:cytidine deaminase